MQGVDSPRQVSQGEQAAAESKKPRRSDRISSQVAKEDATPLKDSQLPSPMTHHESSTMTERPEFKGRDFKDGTVTPPDGRPSQIKHRSPISSPTSGTGLTSPPQDTQPYSQFLQPHGALSSQVQDEESEGVWGYLVPLDNKFGDLLILRERTACPLPGTGDTLQGRSGKKRAEKDEYEEAERKYEQTKISGVASGGYLIGRHPECGKLRYRKEQVRSMYGS